MDDRALEIIGMKDPARFGLPADILSVGDVLLEICGRPGGDQLDFHYYAASEKKVQLKVRRKNGSIEDVTIDADALHGLDLAFSPMDFRRCRCKCPFCFVDQMPKGMRDSLYLKDEDFRLSFLYGNFTTLNDITDREIDRIIEQGISPQYVSVHAVDADMREWIFGRPMKRDILDTLHRLADGGITIHTQAVLCPGKNDGAYLDETISALGGLHDNIASLAVVPVGLTGHRQGLAPLRTYTPQEMPAVIDQVEGYQDSYLAGGRAGRFVFLSDEWFIETDRSVPEEDAYEGYPQLDNGVGMTRNFVEEINRDIGEHGLPAEPQHILVVTGAMGAKVFSKYILPIFSEQGRSVPTVIQVINKFFGETVSVSGLLSCADILDTLRRLQIERGTIYLPPNVLNYEDKFLDGPSFDDFRREVRQPVIVPRESFIAALNDPEAQEGESLV